MQVDEERGFLWICELVLSRTALEDAAGSGDGADSNDPIGAPSS
jgi:hypothetical protein